jgi:hypothetical protein
VLSLSLVGALLALGLAVALAKGDDGRGGGESGTVRAERGTNIAVTVSPDHRTSVMDLQGVLWRLPGAGGVGDDLGTVTPGRVADLALVRGNPLRRIEDAANVRAVTKGGRLYIVGRLIAPFGR